MSVNVESSSKVTSAGGEWLSAAEIRVWIETVPDEARVSQIIKDFGSQRDPAPTLVGLRADWSEKR